MAQTPPDDRAAARELSFAAYRLRVAVKLQVPEIGRRVKAISAPVCQRWLSHLPRGLRADGISIYAVALSGAIFGPVTPALGTFQAELDRIAIGDAALRSGRSAWRVISRALGTLPTVPADLCARLDAWRRSGYRASARPVIDASAFERLEALDDVRLDRKLAGASRRMRTLGVARGTAERFEGDRIFDDVFEDAFDGALGDVPPARRITAPG